MALGDVDLSHLTDEEKNKILEVLHRDEALRDLEEKRIRYLKEEVKLLRLKGTIREGLNVSQTCARCRGPFGMFFNKGSVCPKCQHRVCKKCQQSLVPKKWICVYCFRQMEFEAKSGNWFYTKFPRTMRDRTTNEIVSGRQIVRDAISGENFAGKPLKAISDFQMKQPINRDPVKQNQPVSPNTAAAAATDVPLIKLQRPVELVTTTPPKTQQDAGPVVSISTPPDIMVTNAESKPNASMNMERNDRDSQKNTAPGVPAVCVTPDREETMHKMDDTHSIKSVEDVDFPSKSHPSSPSNLSRLSAMTGSTESVMSYYSCAGEGNFGKIAVTGDIQFGLNYNQKTNNLEITIKRCRDIAPADTKKNRSDPYVKCYLLPDKSRTGKRKTHCKKNTLNPVFDEVIKYSIKRGEIESRTLCVMVWNYDRFGRNDFLGEVSLPLTLDVLQDTSIKWYKLSNRVASPLSVLQYKGDLDVSLKYDNAQRVGGKIVSITDHGTLQVLVKQARNLTALRSNEYSDPFCQAYLLPHRSKNDKQKTAVVKHNCNPVWNHAFIFESLTEPELRESSVELTIWDHDRMTSHEFLGGVRLNLGTGKSNGKEVDWMDAKGDEMALWQSLLDRPNTWIDGTLLLRVYMTPHK